MVRIHDLDEWALGPADKLLQALERGLPLDARASGGDSLAMFAAFDGRSQNLKILLERGVDPNATNDFGATAAHHGAERGQIECLEILAEHGADFAALDLDSRSPAARAAGQGQIAVLEFLASQGVDLAARDPLGRGLAFHAAGAWGGPATLAFLLGHGADLLGPDLRGQTPLDEAEACGRRESAAFLRSHACQQSLDAAARAPDGRSAGGPRL